MFSKKNISAILIFLISIGCTFSQSWRLDNTFNTFGSFSYSVSSTCTQPDGKILVAGSFTNYYNTPAKGLVRLNSDGTIDNTFNIGTGDYIGTYCVKLQSDGKILLGKDRVIRLMTDGSVDNTFTSYSLSTSGAQIYDIDVQSDNKIIVAGTMTYDGLIAVPPANLIRGIIRLKENGQFDPTFNAGGNAINTINGKVNVVKILPNGQLMIGGYFLQFNGANKQHLLKLNSDGTVDNSFNPVWPNNEVSDIELASSDSIIVGGHFSTYGGQTVNYLMKVNINGNLSTSFSSNLNNSVHNVAIQQDGKILLDGEFTKINATSVYHFGRINSNGSLDNSFNSGNMPFTYTHNYNHNIEIQSDGKILYTSENTFYRDQTINYCTRLNTDGSIDDSFFQSNGADSKVNVIKHTGNGKFIAGGMFTTFNREKKRYLTQLNNDGTIDNSLNIGDGFDDEVKDIEISFDGKIFVAGYFSKYNNSEVNHLVCLNPDGTPYSGFNMSNNWVTNDLFDIVLQPDNKLLLGGYFTRFFDNSVEVSRNRIARISSDGTLDYSFDPGLGANDLVSSIALQSDGKIILGGRFTSFNSINKNYLTRINPDGSLDATFNIGTGFDNFVNKIIIQQDGKIIVTGLFKNYNNSTATNIIRLNSDGSRDNDFLNGTGPLYVYETPFYYTVDGSIGDILVRNDGKIIVGGAFNNFNGSSKKNLVLLNSDGTVDESLSADLSDTGSDVINALCDENESKLVISTSGDCENYTINELCRLYNTNITSNEQKYISNETGKATAYIYPNPAVDEANIILSELPSQDFPFQLSVCDLNGKIITQTTITSTDYSLKLSSLKKGVYIGSLKSKNFDYSFFKILVE